MNVPRQSNSANPPIEVVHQSDSKEQMDLPNAESESEPIKNVSVAKDKETSASPEPITPPGSGVEVERLLPPDWTPPLYVKYKLLTGSASVLTVLWLIVISYNFLGGFSTNDISALLPHETGILLA